MITLYLLQIAIGIIGSKVSTPLHTLNSIWDTDFPHWLIYNFPPVRLIDFLIGCNLGYVYITEKGEGQFKSKIYRLLSVVMTVITTAGYYAIDYYTKRPAQSLLRSQPERWWSYCVIFTPVSCMIIFIAAFEKKENKGMGFQKLINFGNLSQFFFLAFFPVFRVILVAGKILIKRLSFENIINEQISIIGLVELSVGFVISFYLANFYSSWIAKRTHNRRVK